MTPTEIHNNIKAAVEAVSKDREDAGLDPIQFLYGRASDIWLENLEAGNVENLEAGGVVHMEFQQLTSIPVDEENAFIVYPVRLIFSKSHDVGDDLTTDLLPLQTDMFNLKQDVLEKLRLNTTTNLTQTERLAFQKMAINEQEFQFFVYGNNVTTGIIADIDVTVKYCRN